MRLLNIRTVNYNRQINCRNFGGSNDIIWLTFGICWNIV